MGYLGAHPLRLARRLSVKLAMSLRFAVGDRVQCKTSRVRWQKGHVSLLHYREDHWPEGQVAPYQIKLDDGRLIYCPADSDSLIRAAVDGDGERARR